MALQVPIQESLLRYSDNLNAHLCFAALMRFMGDQSKLKNQNEVNCIYEILQVCDLPLGKVLNRNCLVLRCSQFFLFHRESVLRGWLLLNLLTGYFLPSNILMPYATKFLQLCTSAGPAQRWDASPSLLCAVARAILLPSSRPSMSNCSGAALALPGLGIYLLLPLLQVAKELLQEICEQMGAGEQEEIQEFALFAIRNKMVRPIRSEEYLHDYLLEDNLVTVTLRRLIWRTPLHFENKIYTDVHYGQVSNKASVSTRNVPSRGRADAQAHGSVPWGEELNEYTPKTLQSSIRVQALESHVGMLLRTRQPLQPVDAKIQFIEHMMKLPFFGYNIYFVERVSDDTIPVPCFFGVNKEEIIVVDDTTQAVSCVIPLKELQKMRTLRPVSDGGLPGIELNYGSAASPKTMWFELSQVRSAWTYSFFLATQKLPSTAQLSLC
uniref:MyTH4 domain-containing protein n=1 Tax=Strix occidentalis caurina TaxID=311401 RepID=A0A8D0FGN2_STROC